MEQRYAVLAEGEKPKIAKLRQLVEDAEHALREIEQQHSKSSEDLIGLLNEVSESMNRKRAELTENKAQYEHIIEEYAQLKGLLNSIVLTLETGRRKSLGKVIQDTDTDHAAVHLEKLAEADPNRVRLGIHRVLNKRRNHAVEAEESSDLGSNTSSH